MGRNDAAASAPASLTAGVALTHGYAAKELIRFGVMGWTQPSVFAMASELGQDGKEPSQ
jgi:hypothetical protein